MGVGELFEKLKLCILYIYIYNHPDNHCFCLEANFFCWSKRIDLSPQPFSGWQPFLGLFWKCGHAWKHHLSVNRTYWNRKKCSSWRNLLIEFQATTLSYQAVKTPTIPGILGIWNWTIFISSIQHLRFNRKSNPKKETGCDILRICYVWWFYLTIDIGWAVPSESTI